MASALQDGEQETQRVSLESNIIGLLGNFLYQSFMYYTVQAVLSVQVPKLASYLARHLHCDSLRS